jgi:hypothetical protein
MLVIPTLVEVVAAVPVPGAVSWLDRTLVTLLPLLNACLHADIAKEINLPLPADSYSVLRPTVLPVALVCLHPLAYQQDILAAFIANTQYAS